MPKIAHYLSKDGTDRFDRWFRRQTPETRARIQTRIDRMELGNFGDHRSVGQGVSELRIGFGPGYRLYYGRDGDELVLLLSGGTKKRQAKDIADARQDWRAYREEKRDARTRA